LPACFALGRIPRGPAGSQQATHQGTSPSQASGQSEKRQRCLGKGSR
jgi:hypothetical protein